MMKIKWAWIFMDIHICEWHEDHVLNCSCVFTLMLRMCIPSCSWDFNTDGTTNDSVFKGKCANIV